MPCENFCKVLAMTNEFEAHIVMVDCFSKKIVLLHRENIVYGFINVNIY